MLRIKDMKKGQYYSFKYQGNNCVTYVTSITAGIVRCPKVVGMWDDSESYEEQNPDHLAFEVNLKDYDGMLRDIKVAGIADEQRYIKVVKAWQAEVERGTRAMEAEQEANRIQGNGITLGEIMEQEGLKFKPKVEKPEDFMPVETPTLGVNVIGQVDLSDKKKMNIGHSGTDNPTRLTKEERKDKFYPKKDGFSVNEYMTKNYHFGFSYLDMEVLEFKYNGRDGVAIGRVDEELHEAGYYVAINMCGENEHITKAWDKEPDLPVNGGVWPDGIWMAKAGYGGKYVGDIMMTQFGDDIEAYKQRIQEALKKQKEVEERARQAKENAERAERLTREAGSMLHLPYIRGAKECDDSYPVVSVECAKSNELYGRYLFIQILERMAAVNKKMKKVVKTYVISREYLHEMDARAVEYKKKYKSYAELGEHIGVLSFTDEGDVHHQLFFAIQPKENECTVNMAQCCGSELEIAVRIITRPWSEDKIAVTRYTKNRYEDMLARVISFVSMETDVNTLIAEKMGEGSITLEHRAMTDSEMPFDIEVRDASWYTTYFVDKTIYVDSYLSHRWCGSGADRHLEEVIVRPYTKNGYTKTAKVLNNITEL